MTPVTRNIYPLSGSGGGKHRLICLMHVSAGEGSTSVPAKNPLIVGDSMTYYSTLPKAESEVPAELLRNFRQVTALGEDLVALLLDTFEKVDADNLLRRGGREKDIKPRQIFAGGMGRNTIGNCGLYKGPCNARLHLPLLPQSHMAVLNLSDPAYALRIGSGGLNSLYVLNVPQAYGADEGDLRDGLRSEEPHFPPTRFVRYYEHVKARPLIFGDKCCAKVWWAESANRTMNTDGKPMPAVGHGVYPFGQPFRGDLTEIDLVGQRLPVTTGPDGAPNATLSQALVQGGSCAQPRVFMVHRKCKGLPTARMSNEEWRDFYGGGCPYFMCLLSGEHFKVRCTVAEGEDEVSAGAGAGAGSR